jgi:ribosomal protein S18 acetylase RimI-like enzyme
MNPAPQTFRPATPNDLPAIRALAHAIWPACYATIISPAQITYMLDRMYSLDQLHADLAANIAYTLLVEHRAPIAFAAHGPAAIPAQAKLHKLYLLPTHHHRGLGTLLLQHVLTLATTAGFTHLTLQVNRHNTAAIAAYQRNGFTITAERRTDIGNHFVMDDYLMSRPLP